MQLKDVLAKHPDRVPVVVIDVDGVLNLPKHKFLVLREHTMHEFMAIVRSRASVSAHQSIFFLCGNHCMPEMNSQVCKVHLRFKDEDGVLRLLAKTENVFG